MAVARAQVDCTEPDDLLGVFPCVTRCINTHELLMVIVMAFAAANGTGGDIPAMEQAAKKFRSLSDDQLLKAMIGALPESWFTSFTDPTTWPESITCIRCYDEQTLKAMLVNQWCTYWSSYGQLV